MCLCLVQHTKKGSRKKPNSWPHLLQKRVNDNNNNSNNNNKLPIYHEWWPTQQRQKDEKNLIFYTIRDRGPTTSIVVVVVIIIIIITKVLKNSPLPWKRRKKEPKDNAKNLGFGLTLLAHIPSHSPHPQLFP